MYDTFSPAPPSFSSRACHCPMRLKSRAAHIGPRVVLVDRQASSDINHLIIVPCHGVTVTESLEGADSRDADWFLLNYQKGKDVPRALVGHIEGALDELDADKKSLLLFSGEFQNKPCLIFSVDAASSTSFLLSPNMTRRHHHNQQPKSESGRTLRRGTLCPAPKNSCRTTRVASLKHGCDGGLPRSCCADSVWLRYSVRRHVANYALFRREKPADLLTTFAHLMSYLVLPRAGFTSLLPQGGKTRGPAGPKSEAESYFFVADHYDWWGKPDLRSRASTEDFARDSFENIMFSICRYVLFAVCRYCCIEQTCICRNVDCGWQ